METEGVLREKSMKLFKEKLKITDEDLKDVDIERIHRIGKASREYTRSIVMKLNSKGKAKVISHIRNIPRGDPVKVVEQLPAEIQTRRNKLWPQFIQAKEAGKQAKFNKDKLIVENRVYNAPKDKVNDINLNVIERSMSFSPRHSSVTTVDRNNHFQAHTVPIKSQDDVIPAIQALLKDPRVAGSNHISYAYRIGNERYSTSNYEDDGENGAGRDIMSVLDQNGVYNCLVAVTRWYSGKQLGGSRQRHIRQAAETAINNHNPVSDSSNNTK